MGRSGEQRIQAETQSIRGGTEFDGIPKITGKRRRILKGTRKTIMRKHDGQGIISQYNSHSLQQSLLWHQDVPGAIKFTYDTGFMHILSIFIHRVVLFT